MIRARFKLFGFFVAIFSVMAFGAAAAQAEVGAKWLFANGTNLIPFLQATWGVQAETEMSFNTEIAKIKVKFSCTTIATENAVLKESGSIGEGARFKLSGCTTALNGATSKSCEPNNEGKEPGVIKSTPGHGLLVLHHLASGEVDDLISFLADSGSFPMLIFVLQMSSECAIGTKVNVIGKITFKDCENLLLTHLVKHLMEVGPLTELWVISQTAEHVVKLSGSFWAYLTGPHAGLKYSGDPA